MQLFITLVTGETISVEVEASDRLVIKAAGTAVDIVKTDDKEATGKDEVKDFASAAEHGEAVRERAEETEGQQDSKNEVAPSATEGRSPVGKKWSLSDLDFRFEPEELRLHPGTFKRDGKLQYEGRTPAEELDHLEKGEAAAYAKALAKEGLPASTPDYPRATTSEEAGGILTKIRENTFKLFDGSYGGQGVVPAVSKGFEGSSDLHVASMPGSDSQVYNDVVLCSLEEQLSFGIVWEVNWNNLWFWVWKLRQREALRSGKSFLVLTKDKGSVGFNQSLEVTYLQREGIPFRHMTAKSFLRQFRPMIQAAWYKKYESVEKLLDHPEVAELLRQQETSGLTTLHVLAHWGKVELLRSALAAGAGLEVRTFAGSTPLRSAAERGQQEALRVLLEARASVDAESRDGGTPLFIAAQKGQKAAAAALIAAKAEVDHPLNNGETPLMMASFFGHLALVRMLLLARADVTRRDHQRQTALDWAHKEGRTDVEALLLAPA